MIDVTAPGTPGWWLNRLFDRLSQQRDDCDYLDKYTRNENGIPVHANKATTQAYQRLMSIARTNYAELVVEAVRERMLPLGFMTGAEGDELGDKEAWRIWQANALDADAAIVHRSALGMSKSYVMVGGVDPEIGAPLITPEDPREVAVELDVRRKRKVVAGLKVYRDDIYGVDVAHLYLPGLMWRAFKRSEGDSVDITLGGWDWLDDGEPSRLRTEIPVVPIVPFHNRPDIAGRAMGEFEPYVSILDRINYTILSRLEIATLQAFRQRAIKGVPQHDAAGNDIDYDDIFSADPGAMWHLPATAEIWESGQVDLGPIRQAIRDDVQDLAAVTRTPLFYLTPDAADGSAEGASLAREGLVFKTSDRIVQAGESWEQVMSLAFLFAGDRERASRRDMEVIWAPPERFSLNERANAAAMAQAGGMPWRSVMKDIWQKSPQEIERMEAERVTDAFLAPDAVTAGS